MASGGTGSDHDSSNLLRQIKQFKKAQLHKVETYYTTEDGIRCIEKIDEAGRSQLQPLEGENTLGFVADQNPDLQVAEILPELFMGSVDVACELKLLTSLKITHILNVTSMKIEYFPQNFKYKHVLFMDLPMTKISKHFDSCFAFIDEAAAQGGRVYLHCMAGISRAASVAIGYLMSRRGMGYEEAYALVKEKRPTAHPNEGFVEQLKKFVPSSTTHDAVSTKPDQMQSKNSDGDKSSV